MAKFRVSKSSGSAAIDWHDLKGSGEVLENVTDGRLVLRTGVAARVAVGVADPGTSNTAGIATVAGEAVEVVLGAAATNQTIWVQTPADQSSVIVEIDQVSSAPVLAAF